MKKYIITTFITLSVIAVNAQGVDRTKQPPPGPAPIIELGSYSSFTLDNGLKVFVVENHKIPKISWQLTLDVDPVLEGKNAGYVNMAGQLLGSGTDTRTKAEIDSTIDFIGASLSTSSTGVFASSLKKHKEILLDVMSDVLLHPVFPKDELEKSRKQMISGIKQSKSTPSAISSNVSSALNYGVNHPYGEQMTEETVTNITIDMCLQYYSDYFHPNVAYLVVVGDITKEEAEHLVKKYFGEWQKADVPSHTYEMPKAPTGVHVAIVDKPGAVQSSINITYPINLKPNDPDAIAASAMNSIFGNGGFMAWLFQDLREGHGYTYGAYSHLSNNRLVGEFGAGAEVRNEVTDSSIVRFLFLMNKMATKGASAEELQDIKNYLSGGFARSLESPQTVARFALNIERYDLPKDYYATYLAKVEALTVDDIKRVSKRFINPGNCNIVVVGNKDEVAQKLSQFASSGKVEFYDAYGTPVSSGKPIPEGVTEKFVIDNYINAIGGAKVLNKIKSQKVVMTMTMQGMPITITKIEQAPNKSFMEVKSGEMVFQKTVFDGTKGKNSGMAGASDFSPEEVKTAQAEVMNKEMKYEELGYKLKLISVENVNGEDTYKMEIEGLDGDKEYIFYSIKTGYKVKSVISQDAPTGGTVTVESNFSDYKDTGKGFIMPYKITVDQAGQVMDMVVSSVEINSKLDKDTFKVE